MKKITSFLFILICINTFSQSKFETYNSSYFSKDYQISIAEEKNGSVSFYLDCSSIDSSSKDATLIIAEKELPEFLEFIISLKETYKKWTTTAIENKVTELSKDVEYKQLKYSSGFTYGKWNFDFSTYLTAKYRIINDKHLMIIKSDPLQSSSNQFIKSDGFVIAFSTESEFSDLITKLDIEKARKIFADKKSKEELFKN